MPRGLDGILAEAHSIALRCQLGHRRKRRSAQMIVVQNNGSNNARCNRHASADVWKTDGIHFTEDAKELCHGGELKHSEGC